MEKRRFLYIFSLGLILLAGCSKGDETDGLNDRYGYEVTCEYCNIRYLNESNVYMEIQGQRNQWKKELKGISKLDITVSSISDSPEVIYVYILRQDSRISTYSGTNVVSASYQVPLSGSAAPVSSLCGAPTQKGTPCQRKVSGGGRCWQHK